MNEAHWRQDLKQTIERKEHQGSLEFLADSNPAKVIVDDKIYLHPERVGDRHAAVGRLCLHHQRHPKRLARDEGHAIVGHDIDGDAVAGNEDSCQVDVGRNFRPVDVES